MKNTIKPPRKKRAYVKKRLLTLDELWKTIIPLLWQPFIHFCLEDWVEKIDFTHKPDFLDKDFKRLAMRGRAKNRSVDIFMRVYLKDGTTKCFLLNIEVQGYFEDGFELRVFQYFYRMSDGLQEPIETLVVMIDEDPDYRPNEYKQVFGQTSVNFKYRMFKLLDNPPPYVGKEDNPFAIAFEVAWYALKQNNLKNDEDIRALRFRLIKRLLERKIEDEKIYALMDFINIYLPFADKEKESIFEREIDLFIDKNIDMQPMTIREYYVDKVERKIERLEKKAQKLETLSQGEARLRKESEDRLTLAIRSLYAQGMSVETIANLMAQPIDFVQGILDKKS